MRDSGFTRQERSFILLMRIWIVAFIGAAIIFAAIPQVLLNYINDIGRVFFSWQSPPVTTAGCGIWIVLSVAFLISLAYVCIIAQAKPLRNTAYARIIILSKFVSSAGFVAILLISAHYFYYLVGAIVDGLICILTWRLYSGALRSRN